MVPLMAAALLVVVAAVVPFYMVFLVVMAFAGLLVARMFRLDPPSGRAVVFSGATRNSLVVLPLALALALTDQLAVAAVVVVTQTLVGMVVYVRLVPRLVPAATDTFPSTGLSRIYPHLHQRGMPKPCPWSICPHRCAAHRPPRARWTTPRHWRWHCVSRRSPTRPRAS